MEIPSELQDILTSSPDTLSGAVRFVGTRVPVEALLDALICHHTIEFFLEGYPGVTREQAEAVLKYEQNQLRQILGLKLAS
ncbi:MAG: DUF433 domain-containing protein [Armatimonadetes bacterium]|nr:DUF433 domain-containing protein [Armatimonadota bacterium]MBS1701439.1 DUF433 domain-containing protein [Armatimonadota bacterium]